METCIDPKVIEILKQLDATKDSVIIAGRGAVDSNREAHATIKQLRVENELLKGHVAVSHDEAVRGNKVIKVSMISIIASWIMFAVCYVYTTLGF